MAPLCQRPVLLHSLQTFEASPCIDEIIVVTAETHFPVIRQWAQEEPLTKLTQLVPGGDLRHHSVQSGLAAVSDSEGLVAVHDGARPLIDPEDLKRCWNLAKKHGAAACARRITDTVKRVDGQHRVMGSVDRTNLWAMETPQVFAVPLLVKAYQQVERQAQLVTDEVSAMELLGEPVILSENLKPNLKITYPQDLELAAQLMALHRHAASVPA